MSIEITDNLVKMYIGMLTAESKRSFLALAERMGEPPDSLDRFVRRFLDLTYNKSNVKIIDSIDEKYANKTYAEIIDILKMLDEDGVWNIEGPQSLDFVESVEKQAGLQLPSSLKIYFVQVGGMQLGDYYLPTIRSKYREPHCALMSNTNHLMKNHSLPAGYFCLDYDHEMRDSACLDLRLMENGECPVVIYNKEARIFEGLAALNFDYWFRSQMLGSIKALEI